nr:MAG TPA: hypothetical protein [Bacteriophage sp.]
MEFPHYFFALNKIQNFQNYINMILLINHIVLYF